MPDDPSSDRRAPVLQSLGFDPPQIEDGKVVTLLLNISDDLSGVKSANGRITSPSGAAAIPFEALSGNDGGPFAARIAIPSKAETGYWFVSALLAADRADNSLLLSFTKTTVPAGGSVLVSSSESDSTAPDVRDMWVEKRSVQGGERNRIRIEVEDDRSGVASVWGSFQSPTKAGLVSFTCRLNADTGFWEGDIAIPRIADCGEWTAQELRVNDKAGNMAVLKSDDSRLARVSFDVASDGCDSSAPTLESLSLSPTTISNQTGGEITLTAEIRDAGSGAISLSGWVSGPPAADGQPPRISFSYSQDPKIGDSTWTGKIVIPQYAARGIWSMGFVRLFDKAQNSRDYLAQDPALSRVTFVVE